MSARFRCGAAICLVLAAPILMGALRPRQDFDSRVLAAHNRERSAIGVPPLRWNRELAAEAQRWAQQLARDGTFEHSPDDPTDPEGENLWAGTAGRYQPESMVGLWISEKRDFKPGIFPNNSRSGDIDSVGHYTQLIWAATTDVGCGLASGKSEDILVCRYKKAGNVIGARPI
jgi:hypothetical protein